MIPGDASKVRRYLVQVGQGGVRIDRFLKRRLPELSRREIAFWIQEQGVLRNGRPVRKGAILHEGDRVDLRIPFGPSGSAPFGTKGNWGAGTREADAGGRRR